MNFDDFHKNISQLQQLPLGGLDAQFKLAPKMRLGYDVEKIKANNQKKQLYWLCFIQMITTKPLFY